MDGNRAGSLGDRRMPFGVSTRDVSHASSPSREAAGQAYLLKAQLDKQLPGTIRTVHAGT